MYAKYRSLEVVTLESPFRKNDCDRALLTAAVPASLATQRRAPAQRWQSFTLKGAGGWVRQRGWPRRVTTACFRRAIFHRRCSYPVYNSLRQCSSLFLSLFIFISFWLLFSHLLPLRCWVFPFLVARKDEDQFVPPKLSITAGGRR